MGATQSNQGNATHIQIKDVRNSNPTSTNSEHKSGIIKSFMKGPDNQAKRDLIVKIMMPLYYTSEQLTTDEMVYATLSWNNILNNSSKEYEIAKKKRLLDETKSCREWLEIIFYERLFDIHPLAKAMFSNPDSQGKFLTSLFSFIFTVLDDEEKFNKRLVDLAKSHCKRGVKACEYAIIGEVMFWSLRKILGPTLYDINTHNAWTKIFSMMLNIIVPISVEYELIDNKSQLERLANYKNREKTPGSKTPLITNPFALNKKKINVAKVAPEDNSKCPYGFKAEVATTRVKPVKSIKTSVKTDLNSPISSGFTTPV